MTTRKLFAAVLTTLLVGLVLVPSAASGRDVTIADDGNDVLRFWLDEIPKSDEGPLPTHYERLDNETPWIDVTEMNVTSELDNDTWHVAASYDVLQDPQEADTDRIVVHAAFVAIWLTGVRNSVLEIGTHMDNFPQPAIGMTFALFNFGGEWTVNFYVGLAHGNGSADTFDPGEISYSTSEGRITLELETNASRGSAWNGSDIAVTFFTLSIASGLFSGDACAEWWPAARGTRPSPGEFVGMWDIDMDDWSEAEFSDELAGAIEVTEEDEEGGRPDLTLAIFGLAIASTIGSYAVVTVGSERRRKKITVRERIPAKKEKKRRQKKRGLLQ